MRLSLFRGLGWVTGLAAGATLCVAQEPLAPPVPLVSAAQQQTPPASESVLRLQAAARAMELGLPAVAVDIYKAELARESSGDRSALVVDLASALLDDDRAAEADEVLRGFVGIPSPAFRLRTALVSARLKRTDAARAEVAALRVDDLDPADRSWYFFLQGQLADAGRDFARAGAFYDQAAAAAVSELQRARFALAREQVRLVSGEFSEAQVSNLRTIMDRNPGRAAGYAATSQLALALNGLGRKPEAIEILRRQLQSLPAEQKGVSNEWQLLLGLIAGPNDATGRNALSRLLASSNDREKQRVALLLLAGRGSSRAAFRVELDRLIAAPTPHPILEDLLLFRAQDQLASKAYAEADADAQRLLETFPGSALKANALGVRVAAAWERSRFRLAADFASRARAEVPPGEVRAELTVLVAEAYFRARDFRSAADAYAAALNEVPAGVPPGNLIFQQVFSDIESGRLDVAATLLDSAASDPRLDVTNRWQAEWNLARALQTTGAEGVKTAYARVERLLNGPTTTSAGNGGGLPQDLRVRMTWLQARLSLDAGEPARTLTLVEALVPALDGVEPRLRTELAGTARLLQAEANFALGREAEGLEILRKVRTDFPQGDAAVYSYVVEADRAAAQNRFVEAQSLLVKLADDFRSHPYAPFALYRAALNTALRGQEKFYNEAYELIERLVRDYPQSDLIFYARLKQGDLLRLLNRFPLAQQIYELLVNNYPQHPDVLLAQLALAACHNAQATAESSTTGQLTGHAESALSIYERLIDRPDASADLRIEAGYNLGLLLSRRGQAEGRARAQAVWWQQVITPFLLEDAQARLLGSRGRFWMSKTLLGLGELLESQQKLEQARDAYALILQKNLPGTALAKAKLARFGVPAAKS